MLLRVQRQGNCASAGLTGTNLGNTCTVWPLVMMSQFRSIQWFVIGFDLQETCNTLAVK